MIVAQCHGDGSRPRTFAKAAGHLAMTYMFGCRGEVRAPHPFAKGARASLEPQKNDAPVSGTRRFQRERRDLSPALLPLCRLPLLGLLCLLLLGHGRWGKQITPVTVLESKKNKSNLQSAHTGIVICSQSDLSEKISAKQFTSMRRSSRAECVPHFFLLRAQVRALLVRRIVHLDWQLLCNLEPVSIETDDLLGVVRQ